MLVGLLYRLNIDRRATEIGLLLATGFPRKKVSRLLLAEGLFLTAIGALVGLAVAAAYAELLLELLRARWPGGELPFLSLHVTPQSFAIGYSASLIVSLLTIFWAIRVLAKV